MSAAQYISEMDCTRAGDEILWRTDWLGTNPVFYNSRTGKVSRRIEEVRDSGPLQFDAEGLNAYLSFGYCALGLTPFKDVRFLPPCSELRLSGGRFSIAPLPDPSEILLKDMPPTNEYEVLRLIQDKVWAWEQSVSGDIIIPTSGGFDSRLLTLCVHDRNRVRSFTYGVSHNQGDSREVVVARKLSAILGTRWDHVELHNTHRHMENWFKLFGCATHAHGMYQIDFYEQVSQSLTNSSRPLLSGIIGDAWSGAVKCPEVSRASEVPRLGYTHGMNADVRYSSLRSSGNLYEQYFETNKGLLASPEGRIVLAMRSKMMLLRYLFEVPDSLGFKSWSPFLDPEVALSMLRLPKDRRDDRKWQREYFHREGVDMEAMGLGGSFEIALNRLAVDEELLSPLSEKTVSCCIDPSYVHWINKQVCGSRHLRMLRAAMLRQRNRLVDIPYLNAALYRLGFREKSDDFDSAYGAYMTLWPIQKVLASRCKDAISASVV